MEEPPVKGEYVDPDRYDSIQVAVRKNKIKPEIDVTATYMWSESCATKGDHFGRFRINSRNPTLVGDLVDGTKAKILIDTGASTNIITENFIKKNEILQNCPCFCFGVLIVKGFLHKGVVSITSSCGHYYIQILLLFCPI